jgi:hypothetical protein
MDRPNESAAHEQSHGAPYIYPNGLESQGPLFPQKRRTIESSANARRHIEKTQTAMRYHVPGKIVIPPRQNCQGGFLQILLSFLSKVSDWPRLLGDHEEGPGRRCLGS